MMQQTSTNPSDIITQAGFCKDPAFAGEVYSHDCTNLLAVIGEKETMFVDNKSHVAVITLNNTDHFGILGVLLYLTIN